MFNISETVEDFELEETLLTLVDVCESEVESVEVATGVVDEVAAVPEFVFPLVLESSVFIDIASSIVEAADLDDVVEEAPDVDGVVEVVDVVDVVDGVDVVEVFADNWLSSIA